MVENGVRLPRVDTLIKCYVSRLRAAGVNDADLAEIAGHRIETMLARYTHAIGSDFAALRKVID